ncbi:MAG: class 3 adenylate cyclase [Flavobacteriaceae bacterium]|jgi:class 3 adenylate cyclase
MARKIAHLLILLCSTFSFGQDMIIEKQERNIEHVDRYIKFAESHTNKDSVFYYYERAQIIAQKIKYKEGNVIALNKLAAISEGHNLVFERLRYPLMLVEVLDRAGKNSERGQARYDLGVLYYDEGLYDKSVGVLDSARSIQLENKPLASSIRLALVRAYKSANNLSDALVIARELQDVGGLSLEQGVSLYKEKAEIYHELKAYDKELGSYYNLLKHIKGTKYAYLTEVTWNNIGYAQKYLGNLSDSRNAFRMVINSEGNVSEDLLGGAHYNLGLNYQNKKDKDSAIIHLKLAVGYLRDAGKWEELARCYNVQSMVHYQHDEYLDAQRAIDAAYVVARDHHSPETLARTHEIQSYLHQDLFEYKLALERYKDYLSIRDSLVNVDRSRERARLFDQYRVEEFEKRLRLIWAEDELKNIDMARLKAEKEAADERYRAKEQEALARLEYSELQARGALNQLKVQEQRQILINQQNELEISQRENELKELALEKERLSASEREKEIQLLAKQNELQLEIQRREQEEFESQLQLIFSVLFFIILILIGILFAYRQLRKRKKQIEAQSLIIIESKKLIEKEKEKSDSLLLNILPVAVAEELKLTGSSKPKLYEEVSVGFTDFAGFTMISEKLSPRELVGKLDEIFLEFDQIVENYGLQRIKTIGDAYMFASGLPVQMDDHAERCVRAGIEMRDYIERHNAALKSGDPLWNLRIGINTGPVVAGVIGIKKFAYDIWGDTVNLAARMESSGEIKKVNISGRTHDKVKELFECEYRGKVHAKNKGEIDMYFVEFKK